MRRGAGDCLAVGIRLSAEEQTPGGRTVEQSRAILRALAADGLIDYASVVIGDSADPRGAAYRAAAADRARAHAGAGARPAARTSACR